MMITTLVPKLSLGTDLQNEAELRIEKKIVESYLNFKKLIVWKKAVEWSTKIILLIDYLQTDRKHYRLIEQIESAVTSVAMNISEGKGRFSKKEFIHFLYIARGSAYETITLLNIFSALNWISNEKLIELELEGTEIIKMLNGLIKSIKTE